MALDVVNFADFLSICTQQYQIIIIIMKIEPQTETTFAISD